MNAKEAKNLRFNRILLAIKDRATSGNTELSGYFLSDDEIVSLENLGFSITSRFDNKSFFDKNSVVLIGHMIGW